MLWEKDGGAWAEIKHILVLKWYSFKWRWMSSFAHISTLFSVCRDRGGSIHSLKSALLKKKKNTHFACIDLSFKAKSFSSFGVFPFGYYCTSLRAAEHCHAALGKRENLPQLCGNTCLHSQGKCNSSRPRKQSGSVPGLNCAVNLTAKRSTDASDIKPVSPDAIGQACEVKGRRGEKCYGSSCNRIVSSRCITSMSGKNKAARPINAMLKRITHFFSLFWKE